MSGTDSGLQALSQVGIHPASLGGILGKTTHAISTVYSGVTTFSISYGAMFLVIAGLTWLIGWKFRMPTVAGWSKRVISGVFIGEIVIVLLPQLFFSFVGFLSHI